MEKLTKTTAKTERVLFDADEIKRILCAQLGWVSENTIIALSEDPNNHNFVELTKCEKGEVQVDWD